MRPVGWMVLARWTYSALILAGLGGADRDVGIVLGAVVVSREGFLPYEQSVPRMGSNPFANQYRSAGSFSNLDYFVSRRFRSCCG
jgi:hypothetical protein